MTSSIGGYFGLETPPPRNTLLRGNHLFNSGRSALLFHLKINQIQQLYSPTFICGTLIEYLQSNGIQIKFYRINGEFEITTRIPDDSTLLYVNYFGIKDSYIESLSEKHTGLIVDNSQALFNPPINNIPTFYSVRKFIGVPDGGILSTNQVIDLSSIERFKSFSSFLHLTKQVDLGTESGYSDFQTNEQRLANSGIQRMSRISEKIIEGLDIEFIKTSRKRNWAHLNDELSVTNLLKFSKCSLFTYPLMIEGAGGLRSYLIKKKIFTPTLWSDQLPLTDGIERDLIENIIYLPIDQRYTDSEMEFILKEIRSYNA